MRIFLLQKNRQMKTGQNNKYDISITKTQACQDLRSCASLKMTQRESKPSGFETGLVHLKIRVFPGLESSRPQNFGSGSRFVGEIF